MEVADTAGMTGHVCSVGLGAWFKQATTPSTSHMPVSPRYVLQMMISPSE